MPRRASIETVNAVPSGARFSATIMLNPSVADVLFGERQADQAAAVLRHEVDGLGRDLLGRHAQVAFVLPVLVIHEDDHLAGLDVGDRVFDRANRPGPFGGLRNVVNMPLCL